ncbi:Fic family protein [Francisella philomiragia]|uniref:Fic family protein n=1 Tax=Francisella philomiragia TaxID=28110 RepID=UPI001B8AC362|nr:Fic family protein [Francisella philomiragia]QUE32418.1 Fic family protein [Francisella philomiragia]
MYGFKLSKLPVDTKYVETKDILKKSIQANRYLAELNGLSNIIPNSSILINSLVLQEAKDSSEIENIITTHDELYRSSCDFDISSPSAKEVQNYRQALLTGVSLIKKNGFLSVNFINIIQEVLENNNAGIRTQIGTSLKNQKTGEVIYTPPQEYGEIISLMTNLESYINNDNEIDTLINMAIIHYQFESIHPYYDGNGRTGRIINLLYLIMKRLLDIPILYLSNYIIKNKSDYYRLLQEVKTKDNWQDWILFMLDSVEQTAKDTIELINKIKDLILYTKKQIKSDAHKIYSKDLVELIFEHPYTKIDFLIARLNITRQTASKYLKKLCDIGILEEINIGKYKYFINIELFSLLKKNI